MADKILSINFSGICTLWPGPPTEEEEKQPDYKPREQVFVLMAATLDKRGQRGKQLNHYEKAIPEHFPFVHVAASLIVKPPKPHPDENVVICEGGEHFIYYFRDVRVVIDPPKPGTCIKYMTDPKKRPLAERPGSDDVAPAWDFRWIVQTREIFSDAAPLKIIPADENVGREVLAIVNLDGGALRANFPADTVNAKTFADVSGPPLPDFRRALPDEFVIDIPYPENTKEVTLTFKKLRKGKGSTVTAPRKLVLKWPDEQTRLKLRMGYDPKEEIRLLDTEERFDPVRLIGPVLKPRDDDFDLHYNLLDCPYGQRPLPQNDIHQCRFDDCKPLVASDPSGSGT